MEAKRKHDGGVSLPEDVVFEVLARLPAKTLCRFRCVCKGWCALIGNPAFVAAQRSRAGPHLVGVFAGACTWPPEVRVMDLDGNVVRVFKIRRLLDKDDGTDVLGVLQQATTRLNLICVQDTGTGVIIIDLAAGRACSVRMDNRLVVPRFGRAAPSGTFKVICLEETLPGLICKVATIVQGGAEPLTWRERSAAPPFFTSWNSERVTVNGVAYFMDRFNQHDDAPPNSGSDRILVAFDLESEEWKMTNGPAFGIQDETKYVTLCELKGTLGLVQCLRNDDRWCAIIWLLIDFNKSIWVKEYTIQMPRKWGLTKLLGALDDGRILLLVCEWEKVMTMRIKIRYCQRGDVVVFYNTSTKTFTEFLDYKAPMRFGDILVLYTGSLLSV